jgi:Holliday junction resolvase RusA-like endonuclease
MLEITVLGTAQPQGSKTVYAGRAVDANAKKLKPWRKAVTQAVIEQTGDWKLTADPIQVSFDVFLPRPRTVTRPLHTVKPDADKIARALCDGITDAKTIWVDDSQVIDLRVRKHYVWEELEPQVTIRIYNALEKD